MRISTKRVLAFIIDMSIISMVFGLIQNFIPLIIEIREYELGTFDILVKFSFVFVFYFLYLFAFDFAKEGRTVGKMIFNILVISRKTMKTPKRKMLLLRSSYKVMSMIVLPISVLLFYFFDQFTLQDTFCDTETIKSNMA